MAEMPDKTDFWKTSWESIDPARLSSYIQSLDMTEDALIAFLRQSKLETVCDASCGCGIYFLELVPHELSCQQAVRLESNGGSVTMLISKLFKVWS